MKLVLIAWGICSFLFGLGLAGADKRSRIRAVQYEALSDGEKLDPDYVNALYRSRIPLFIYLKWILLAAVTILLWVLAPLWFVRKLVQYFDDRYLFLMFLFWFFAWMVLFVPPMVRYFLNIKRRQKNAQSVFGASFKEASPDEQETMREIATSISPNQKLLSPSKIELVWTNIVGVAFIAISVAIGFAASHRGQSEMRPVQLTTEQLVDAGILPYTFQCQWTIAKELVEDQRPGRAEWNTLEQDYGEILIETADQVMALADIQKRFLSSENILEVGTPFSAKANLGRNGIQELSFYPIQSGFETKKTLLLSANFTPPGEYSNHVAFVLAKFELPSDQSPTQTISQTTPNLQKESKQK